VLDFPFPCRYDAVAKHWLFNEGQISWDEVFVRWKARGPMNEIYVESVRRSHGPMKKMLEVA
jgi:ring-1,2-phenylacetyl-CoA epoxidase subunit PaaA